MNTKFDLDQDLVEHGAKLLRVLNHELRQQKLHYTYKKGRVIVYDLKEVLKID